MLGAIGLLLVGTLGAELFVSRKTASAHVSRVLAKLQVATRGEAAAYAWAHGLAEMEPGHADAR